MSKTDYVKGVNIKNLTKQQKTAMKNHQVHHTVKHLKVMVKAMKRGNTFTQSHNIAMKKVGK
tara:strand:- start:33 stop:218 length:186 start_codon:yes stop_codon:yes gene_type:complete